MFGVGLPILYPIAVLALVILYISEKYMLYYAYQVPPMYDEKLSQNVIAHLKVAPLIMLLSGYWMLSSKQLLSNDNLTPKARTRDVDITGHTVSGLAKSEGWAAPSYPLLLTAIFVFICIVLGTWLNTLFNKTFKSLNCEEEIEDVEDLDTYWNSLSKKDRRWTIQEEEYFREKMVDEHGRSLRMPILLDSQLEALKKSETNPDRTMTGCHTYDILANPCYFGDFQYVPVSAGFEGKGILREDIIKDDDYEEGNDYWVSDKVRVGLNLAYITESEAKEFDISQKVLKFKSPRAA
jgi:hypothetical protein